MSELVKDLLDLASERVGGAAIEASDDFFASKSNLLKREEPIFIANKFTENGKWMDGWESRRKRAKGHDWVVIELGVPGVIEQVDIDTTHFKGNHPPYASLESSPSPTGPWKEILEKSKLKSDSKNVFGINSIETHSFLRLNIFPDGGVARLRVYGEARPDFSKVKGQVVDLANVQLGGKVLACNDMFFGPKENLILPGRALNMGDGWETKRKRGVGATPGSFSADWVVLKLGHSALIKKIIVDTSFFKGNFPDTCSMDGFLGDDWEGDQGWRPLLSKKKLTAHADHTFDRELEEGGPFSHLRLNIFPDGGVSRLRVYGVVK